MYPPKHHQDSNKNHLIEVVKQFPLATLVSIENNKPLITHAPIIYKNGVLIGHIDKTNPQVKLLKDQQEVTLIFSGPQCYISPSIYTTEQLPTWNYIKVHITGLVTEITNTQSIKESMVEMTQFLEPDNAYVLDIKNPKMDQAIQYVSAFTITPTNWEGKFKLSQDKIPTDILQAKNALVTAHKKDIEHFINKIFKTT